MELKKNDTNELIYKAETDSQIETKLMVTKQKRERGINKELAISRYKIYIKQKNKVLQIHLFINYNGKESEKNIYYNSITSLYTRN